ncbi:hypothetical protein NW759_016965 [Fusarium solani]|nr:hypothetical protein NW759_016965 [Fusarium solani]
MDFLDYACGYQRRSDGLWTYDGKLSIPDEAFQTIFDYYHHQVTRHGNVKETTRAMQQHCDDHDLESKVQGGIYRCSKCYEECRELANKNRPHLSEEEHKKQLVTFYHNYEHGNPKELATFINRFLQGDFMEECRKQTSE